MTIAQAVFDSGLSLRPGPTGPGTGCRLEADAVRLPRAVPASSGVRTPVVSCRPARA
jgi:hypothetical protein